MTSTDNKSQTTIKKVNCPTCQTIVPWNESSKYRPFCSRKCRLIDFGEWAAEKHAIPAEEPPDDLSFMDRGDSQT